MANIIHAYISRTTNSLLRQEKEKKKKDEGMTKQKHVISKKGILRSSRAQWIFPGFLLLEQRDEQSVMGQSVCLFTSAHQSCSAVRYHSTAAHWAHPNLPQEVWIIWSYAPLRHPPCLESLLCVYEQTAHSSGCKIHTFILLNRWLNVKLLIWELSTKHKYDSLKALLTSK